MKISLIDKEFIFNNIILIDNILICKCIDDVEDDTNTIIFPKVYKIDYSIFVDLLSKSFDNYVSCNTNDIKEVIEQYFSYFKLTTNPIVKKNSIIKIAYLLLNNIEYFTDPENKEFINIMLDSYQKKDIYLTYLKILLRLDSINDLEKDIYEFEDFNFNFLDFILDYHIY